MFGVMAGDLRNISSSSRRWASVQFAAIVSASQRNAECVSARLPAVTARPDKVILRLLLTMLLHLRHQLPQP